MLSNIQRSRVGRLLEAALGVALGKAGTDDPCDLTKEGGGDDVDQGVGLLGGDGQAVSANW